MALLSCIYNSRVLGAKTAMNVILPDPIPSDSRSMAEIPVFYLLHGLDGNYMSWCTNTRIEVVANRHRVAVVMPEAKNSFYRITPSGEDYYTHISKEVPSVARYFYGLSAERELNHIAGISMGGFGAMKIALMNPCDYATVGSLSSVFDITHRLSAHGLTDYEKGVILKAFDGKSDMRGTQDDIYHLLDNADVKDLPKIYQFCGEQDFLFEDNLRFKAECESLGADFAWTQAPGEHLWPVWSDAVWDYIPWAIDQAQKTL